MNLPNLELRLPPARSQFIKYAAIQKLIRGDSFSIPQLIGRLSTSQARSSKLQQEFGELENDYHIFKQVFNFELKKETTAYRERVIYIALKVAEHVFNPKSRHPLRMEKNGSEFWVKADDLDFIALTLIYSLTLATWSKNLLIIGLVKDTSGSELMNFVVPLLNQSHLLDIKLPHFNSNKMLLQTHSVVNFNNVRTPWHSIDIDAAFRTMALEKDKSLKKGEMRVKGAS
jgi:hypothetical protein